ncbi:MAG: membrane protein insertase YidC [Paludibacter sp.]|jgi:YidC/Oxa1 family membrane protein insertase|nr:membrane protein insertase YidC [Bacteroidales bacterium]
MDKNTILGFVLIAAILITFSILNRPSLEEIERQRAYQDSLRIAQQELQEAIRESAAQKASDLDAVNHTDSSSEQKALKAYGDFKSAVSGEENLFVLENDLIKITLSNKGGRIVSAQLKEHLSRDSLPVELFHQDDTNFGFTMALRNNHIITTSSLFFNPVSEVTTDSEGNQQMIFRLQSETDAYIDFVYTLPANDYMLDFTVKSHEMSTIMPLGSNYMIVNWDSRIRQQEKGRQFEERYSTLNYKYLTDDMEKMNAAKDDEKKLAGRVKWIAFKDQYFSSILIAGESFSNTHLISKVESKESGYMKSYQAEMTVDYNPMSNEDMNFKFYLGPNRYKTLAAYDKGLPSDQKLKLRDLVPLGWGIFGWVSRFAIIPMFDFFSSFISNFGVIILLMTIVIKLVLFPLTYKSYVSSAKMRVLKPEIDEINERIPPEKAAERQKATMELYNKVGVSPFSGCIPTLLQMPILFAMFMFFPSSIELRGESFLWAKDLSSYDAIVSWDVYIPFISKFYGNHISLFTLLMTITTLISTKLNMANTNTSDQPGAGMMKWMMYLMPIMFMFIFNSYASGLSYYYFVSTLLTIVQTFIIRSTIDEEKLLAQLHAKRVANTNKKQQSKKKSSFMERLEKMQREQEKLMRERNKKR